MRMAVDFIILMDMSSKKVIYMWWEVGSIVNADNLPI